MIKVLEEIKNLLEIKQNQVLYVGDDLNDLAVKDLTGIFAVPNDAVKAVKDHADLILYKRWRQRSY